MQYDPHYWQVIKISTATSKPIYKVFGSWRGGYLDGDSWQMNSGITAVKTADNLIMFEGSSGSQYICVNDEHHYRTTAYTGSVLAYYVELAASVDATIEVLPFNTDWSELNYEY